MRGVYEGCYDVFICIRGDDLRDERIGTTHIRVGLDTLYVLGRVVFVYDLMWIRVGVYVCLMIVEIGNYGCVFIEEDDYAYAYLCKI